jgi:hypothetical protein
MSVRYRRTMATAAALAIALAAPLAQVPSAAKPRIRPIRDPACIRTSRVEIEAVITDANHAGAEGEGER